MVGTLRVAVPPGHTVDRSPRCRRCGKLLARYLTRPWRIDCPRCKTVNRWPDDGAPATEETDDDRQ